MTKVSSLLMSGLLCLAFIGHVCAAGDLERDKRELKTVVTCVATVLGKALKRIPDEKTRVLFLRDVVDKIRFLPDRSGYLFLLNLKGEMVAHAHLKHLHGKNLINHKDKRGKLLVREEIEIAKKGGGWNVFYWPRPGAAPGSAEEHKKLSYVTLIPGTDYFIGSGLYVR